MIVDARLRRASTIIHWGGNVNFYAMFDLYRYYDPAQKNMFLVFTSSFNRFRRINSTQAWSLFLTGCKKDDSFGKNLMVGKYITVAILGAIIAQIVEATL